jgi:electron transfer flavoprotein beta subunit
MKCLVAVKDVASVDDEFEIDGLSVDEGYVTHELNEWDEYALEEAVSTAEARADAEVVTVTVGPESAEETIRQALAKGTDRAIRIWDDALEAATLLDPAVTASLLEAVVREEEPDVVFTGVMASDSLVAATGVTLAERLDWGWAAVVTEVEIADGVASVQRELEGGLGEDVDVELPAVLTIQTGINDPRYASLRGIRQAQSKELAEKELADLGLDADAVTSPVDQRELYEPVAESEARILEGDADATSEQLAEILRERGVGG